MNKILNKSHYYSLIADCNQKKLHLLAHVKENGVVLAELDNIKFTYDKKQKTIAVVGGGMSAEREVSYSSSDGIVNAIIALGFNVVFVDMGIDLAQVLTRIKPDMVFNALHGTYGEDGCVPGLLNILRIPYTGPGVLASALAMNKKKSYEIFSANGIKTIETKLVTRKDGFKTDPIKRPYIIKPVSQGSSIGIELVMENSNFSFSDYDFPYGDEVMVEPYIKGREIQVAVLNGKALGLMELKFLKGKLFYDYEAKYQPGFTEHIYPAPIDDSVAKHLMQTSEKVCNIFACTEGIIRIEFIYEESTGNCYILELNTHTGMTPLSICPEIASYQGISYNDLVAKILANARFET